MPPEPSHDTNGNVTAWRLEQLEDQIKTLVQALQSSTSSLGSQITALSNQIGVGLASLPDNYAPRREAEERHRGINERFDEIERRQQNFEKALEQRFLLRDKALDERERGINERITGNTKLIQRIEGAGWGLAAGLLLSLAGTAFSVLKPG